MPEPLLRMERIGMSFGGTRALDDVTFDLAAGEVHVLAGENGAGKSTLIKILAGAHISHDGRLVVGEHAVRFRSPRDAARHGIAVIHQELSLVPPMSVLDNLFLGVEVGRRERPARAKALLDDLAVDVDPGQPVEALPLPTQQLIEIAKALVRDAKIMVMDEPTSALGEADAERLFAIIDRLKGRGCGVIYVTHRMEEIYRLADRITVLRDGRRIGTGTAAEVPRDRLVSWMVGREWTGQFPARTARVGQVRLSVKGLNVHARANRIRPVVNDVMFSVRAGEILGLAGLQGSGCPEVLHALFGAAGKSSRCERMELDGGPVRFRDPADAVRAGVALLTSDRKATGIVGAMSVGCNVTLAALPRFSRGGWLCVERERAAAQRRVEELGVRLGGIDQDMASLSGGNQQKALLGRWLETEPRVLLLDEPTRGIDVGAKHEIYELMNRWTAAGMAIVLITSEMEELLALADRILVMHRGKVTAEFMRAEATREKVLQAAMGEA